MNKLANITQRRAKKIHYCDDCGKPILPGCEYLDIHVNAGGVTIFQKAHIHCDALIRAFYAKTGQEVYFGQMEPVSKWLFESACSRCAELDGCSKNEISILSCPVALRYVLPPTVQGAAIVSASENKGDMQ